jgi:TonB-dependent starch-binding outer membrane protein SusC
MKKIYRSVMRTASVFLLLLITLGAYAQKSAVTGTITDAGGAPMPGVNVILKGTTNGTSSDGNGNFTIEASPDDILVISFIGYSTQEIKVDNQTRIDIKMQEDVSTLSEIVVVGYGEMKRTDLSSAQVSVSSEQIAKTVNTTFEQGLQGRAAGVYVTQNTGQPGGGISVNIRGISSLTGSNEPLYVIDGVQISGAAGGSYGYASSVNPLASINPADIESFEVLQGPSATAIYGSRASNGVIVVTTKRGKSGVTKINYNFLYTLQEPPKELPTMNLQQYAEFDNALAAAFNREGRDEFQNPALLGKGTNWQDELYRAVPLVKHQVSITGGNDKTQFYLSGENFDQQGVALGSHFERNGIRLNIDNQTRPWFKISTNLALTQTKDKLTSTADQLIVTALSQDPSNPVKNPDGTWGGPSSEDVEYSQAITAVNPIALATLNKRELKRSRAQGGITVDITPLKGLLLRNSVNGNFSYSRGNQWEPSFRFGPDQVKPQRRADKQTGEDSYWNLNTLLQYQRKFGDHDVTLMASHEAQESNWNGFSGWLQGHITNNLDEFGNQGGLGDGNNDEVSSYKGSWAMESFFGRLVYVYKDKYVVQATYRGDGSSAFGARNRWAYFPSVSAAWRISEEAFFGNITQVSNLKLRLEAGTTGNQNTYGGSYFASLNSILTWQGPGFYAANYDNPGLKWERTKNYNIGLDIGLFNDRVQVIADFYLRNVDNLLMQLPLPDFQGASNINNPAAIGKPVVNIGAMQNKGFAITLKTSNVKTSSLKWDTDLNVSVVRNNLKELYSQSAFLDRTQWFMPNFIQRSVVGNSVWQFMAYEKEGIWMSEDELMDPNAAIPATNIKSVNSTWVGDIRYKDQLTEDTDGDGVPDAGDGVIDQKDQVIKGNPWPKFTFGITNDFNYKAWTLSVLLTGSYGNDIFNYMRFRFESPYENGIRRNRFEKAFDFARLGENGEGEAVVTNAGTTVPRLQAGDPNGNNNRATTDYIEDGSYLRVKSIQLAYQVPTGWLKKTRVINSARLSLGVQNLATFTKYKGYDPEVGAYTGYNSDPNQTMVGVDYGRYPLTRMYTFAIDLEF